AGWHIARANEIAGWRNTLGLVSEQSPYNLMQRSVELEVIPAIQEYGMGLIAYSPLAGGLLAGALEKVNEGRRSQGYMVGEIESNRPKLDQWETLCKELGHRPADVALSWLLHQPAVTAPVIGPRTEAQLLGSMRALDIEMSEEVLGKLDEIFPGPGGPAPRRPAGRALAEAVGPATSPGRRELLREPVHVVLLDGRAPREEDLPRRPLVEREHRAHVDDRPELVVGVDGVDADASIAVA